MDFHRYFPMAAFLPSECPSSIWSHFCLQMLTFVIFLKNKQKNVSKPICSLVCIFFIGPTLRSSTKCSASESRWVYWASANPFFSSAFASVWLHARPPVSKCTNEKLRSWTATSFLAFLIYTAHVVKQDDLLQITPNFLLQCSTAVFLFIYLFIYFHRDWRKSGLSPAWWAQRLFFLHVAAHVIWHDDVIFSQKVTFWRNMRWIVLKKWWNVMKRGISWIAA